MNRFFVPAVCVALGVAALATTGSAAASGTTGQYIGGSLGFSSAVIGRVPPGGPASKQLLGTWKTRLTAAEVAKADKEGMPAGNPMWLLVILNSPVGNSPRVLGLRPVGEQLSAPTIPFAVQGQLIHLQCLNTGAGLPIAGHDTFRWSVRGGSLRLRAVRLVCKKNPFDRNRAVILASEPWRRGR